MREGSLEPPVRHPLDWNDPDFYDLRMEALALLFLMLVAMTFAVRRFRRTLD